MQDALPIVKRYHYAVASRCAVFAFCWWSGTPDFVTCTFVVFLDLLLIFTSFFTSSLFAFSQDCSAISSYVGRCAGHMRSNLFCIFLQQAQAAERSCAPSPAPECPLGALVPCIHQTQLATLLLNLPVSMQDRLIVVPSITFLPTVRHI